MSVMLRSPDRFTSFDGTKVHQPTALREEFSALEASFPFVEKKVKDPYLAAILRQLLKMANEFYVEGDKRNGNYAMQEIEGTIWPSKKIPSRHAPEAERRAHGKVERYAGVIPSPYPLGGSEKDMGEHQRRLFLAVSQLHTTGAEKWESRQVHAWVLLADGQVIRVKSKSQKATTQQFSDDLANGTALAALRAENVFGDLYVYDVEEVGKPRISVRGKRQDFQKATPNYVIEAPVWAAAKVS
ncbi:hypothetical protein [uncultured Pseudacidovorax sp.]|uniref:hypothetical protein n=1 Tax=uncultured Pseudacidovorax sp. TaxID=679313 RepID=UPI0025DE66F7|nr:hypothetical protein [uncultured Pseudacidovorax sp.]